MRVKIKKIPNAAYGGQQPNGALDVTPSAWGGADVDSKGQKSNVKKTLTSVPRDEANLEAEGGETAFGPISGDTIPDHMVIKGPRHSKGGVPLDLPEDTFIFSDTKKMKINDPNILRMFGKSKKKGGYTPAELAKPYDINKYKAILMDKDSDRLDRENAELMIKNYIMKLGALAIAQESKKGFPQGIPEMARPYMEANGISEEDLMPQQEQEGQPEMPEGEMGEGGTPEYPHGGFHTPFEDAMKKAKETDFTALSAPNLQGPQGQYTEDEVLSNPITGAEPGVRMNTEGELYENQKQEGIPGQDISYEVGVKNAYDVDGNMLADQGAYLAGVATNIGEQVKTSKKMKNIFDKSVDQDARENVRMGIHYANTPGVVAPSGVSPTTVQYKMSQYGGALDKFVYGGDEPMMNTNPPSNQYKLYNSEGRITGTVPSGQEYLDAHPNYRVGKSGTLYTDTGDLAGKGFGEFYKAPDHIPFSKMGSRTLRPDEMAYGGTPMSMYGMEMGGSYYPTMSTGGTRRVKITGLPRKHDGGEPGHTHLSYDDATERNQEEYDAATEADGWVEKTDDQGRTYKVLYKDGVAVETTKQDYVAGNEEFKGTAEEYLDSIACDKIKASGMTVADFIANHQDVKLWDYSNAKFNAYLAKCENVVEGEGSSEKAIKVVNTPNPQECNCKKLDADGNWTGEYEVYEGTINEETGKLECPDCEYEEEITTDPPEYEEPARWSQRAIGNLLTQGRFRTDAERLDPELVDRPEYSPVLQRRYDQDIQSNLAGLRKSIDTGGGTAQQKLFQNLAALDQATTQVGKRQKQTEDYNINVLNQAAQIAANLQQSTDARNQQAMMKGRTYNAQAGDKETAAKNAKMQAMNLAKTDAQNEMLQKATWNFNNPEFQIDYKTGMPYYNPNYKDPNATKGQKDLTEEYMRILGDLGADDANNKQVAYNLAVKSVYGNTKTKQHGGYVSGNDMYPFFND